MATNIGAGRGGWILGCSSGREREFPGTHVKNSINFVLEL